MALPEAHAVVMRDTTDPLLVLTGLLRVAMMEFGNRD
jgi:hypothetical protein